MPEVYRNLTAHPITIQPPHGEPVTYWPDHGGRLPAIWPDDEGVAEVSLAAVGEVIGLPSPADDVWLIVSPGVALVATALGERWDLVCVDESRPVWQGGQVIGYERLIAWDLEERVMPHPLVQNGKSTYAAAAREGRHGMGTANDG